MSFYNILQRTKGLIAPLVTWRKPGGGVDLDAMGAHADHLMDGGLDGGVFVLGSTGEFAYLTLEEKGEIIRYMVEHVNGRVPVIAGISSCSVARSLELARIAIDAGVDGLMALLVPFFKLAKDDVVRYYRDVSKHLDGKVPLFLYHMPAVTGLEISPELVFSLAREKVIQGVKYTGGDAGFVERLAGLRRSDYTVECNVWVGIDRVLLECLEKGIEFDGALMGSLNIFPGFYQTLIKNFKKEPRNEAVCSALAKTVDIVTEMFSMELRELPALVKEVLHAAGLPFARSVDVASPLPPLGGPARERALKCLELLKRRGVEI